MCSIKQNNLKKRYKRPMFDKKRKRQYNVVLKRIAIPDIQSPSLYVTDMAIESCGNN